MWIRSTIMMRRMMGSLKSCKVFQLNRTKHLISNVLEDPKMQEQTEKFIRDLTESQIVKDAVRELLVDVVKDTKFVDVRIVLLRECIRFREDHCGWSIIWQVDWRQTEIPHHQSCLFRRSQIWSHITCQRCLQQPIIYRNSSGSTEQMYSSSNSAINN